MILLVLLVVTGLVTSVTAVATLVAVRRRLATELALARGAIALEQGARDEVKGLLDVSHEARAHAEEEAEQAASALRGAEEALAQEQARAEEALAREQARARAELSPLHGEIARLAAASAAAEERLQRAAAERIAVEARLTELTVVSATATKTLTARAARLTTARAAAEEGAAQLAKQQQQLLADLDLAKRASAEADEARRLAEEEARITRTAKDSFAGEARLLREEVLRVQAKLDEALRRSEAPPVPVAVKPKVLAVTHTLTWWCVACNEGGVPGPKPHVCRPEEKKK
jgi:chromosome segregation ATPase